jgi:hypothetical protein
VASQLRSKMVATGVPHAERVYGAVAATYARYTAAWTSMRTSLHGDHAKARAQFLAAAASAATLHAKDALMYYLLVAGKESLALDDAPAAIDQYRRCAESLPVPRGVGTTRFALAETLWRRNGGYDRARARLLAIAPANSWSLRKWR